MSQPAPAQPPFNAAAMPDTAPQRTANAALRAKLGQQLLEELGKGRAPAADAALLSELLARGASVQEKNSHGQTALMVAIHYHHSDIAAAILAAGASVHARDDKDNTPLVWCGYMGDGDTALKILQAGAHIDDCNSIGRSALSMAASKGHDDFLKKLIGRGCDANHMDRRGDTLLTAAVQAQQVETVRLLIELGADAHKAGRSGKTPAAIAQEKGYVKLAAAIENTLRRQKKKAFDDDVRQITEGTRGDVALPAPLNIRKRPVRGR